MRRRLFVSLLVIAMLFCAQGAYAATDASDILADGLVTYQETGDLVASIQVRLHELDYFYFKPTGKFQSMTRSAVIEFQKNQVSPDGKPIIADGTVGAQSLGIIFSTQAIRAPIPVNVKIPIGEKANGKQTQTGNLVKWSEVKAMLVSGQSYELTDFNTGTKLSMTFIGGEQHAEMECATANDATTFKQIFGGDSSYFKRPMLISVNSQLVACSLQGQPHGEDSVARNDMIGHACLYFYESKSHVGALPDVEHINNVYMAAGRI